MEECRDKQMPWDVYIILCSDNTLYTGITTDIERRLKQHASGRGARYFRGRRPVKPVYRETGHTRSTAAQREAAIKRMKPADKSRLICSPGNEMADTAFGTSRFSRRLRLKGVRA